MGWLMRVMGVLETTASSNVEPVLVMDSVEGVYGHAGMAKADTGVAATATWLVAAGGGAGKGGHHWNEGLWVAGLGKLELRSWVDRICIRYYLERVLRNKRFMSRMMVGRRLVGWRVAERRVVVLQNVCWKLEGRRVIGGMKKFCIGNTNSLVSAKSVIQCFFL